MPAQGHAHVVHLHRDGVAADKAFMQHLDAGTLNEAQLQQPSLELQSVLVRQSTTADLDDHAAVAPSSQAEFEGIGHYARNRRRVLPAPVDTDYQVRLAFVQSDVMQHGIDRALFDNPRPSRRTLSRLSRAALFGPLNGSTDRSSYSAAAGTACLAVASVASHSSILRAV